MLVYRLACDIEMFRRNLGDAPRMLLDLLNDEAADVLPWGIAPAHHEFHLLLSTIGGYIVN
jgi:hypothetical protein